MKIWFILLSMLAAILTWWWHSRPVARHGASRHAGFLRRLAHSIIAGVAVYFSLMAIAMVWLLTTT